MRPADALTQPKRLLNLIKRLEPGAHVVDVSRGTAQIVGGLLLPSPVDPGSSIAYFVAADVPSARGGAEKRWWSENREEIERCTEGHHTSDITVVFPGNWPRNVWRTGTSHNSRVRLVSSTYHLWVDRLKQHDQEGKLDEGKRQALTTKLAGSVDAENEKRYTRPALYPALSRDGSDSDAAIRALLAEPADPLPGLTVLFGPGGIGKSFFLRHMASQLGRLSCRDPLTGIPVYAELPLLLHTDALETWLAKQGIRLPIDAIRALIEEGVIVPVLDALDELVRGQAREGSRQFLAHLRDVIGGRAKGVLSSRDYYLNLDPLVTQELGSAALLSVGFFDRPGRRRYVQMRTGLQDDHAAKWTSRLESQAAEALNGAAESEIEPLVGHPLFLDAFCQMIMDIPASRRASGADTFQLRSPDIFGEIVDSVLRREHEDKFLPAWHAQSSHQRMSGEWKDPFTPQRQTRVLREIVLQIARSGGAEALRRSQDDPSYKDIRHGLFVFGADAEQNDDVTATLRTIIESVLGKPATEPTVHESEVEETCEQAVTTLIDAFRSHTLADTEPGRPGTLVFATRHRAYFDYLLAQAVLDELILALDQDRGLDEDFVLWAIEHNIIEHSEHGDAPPFASCLDFVLWHRTAVEKASEAALRYLSSATDDSDFSDELASYVVSLGLALILRKGQQVGRISLSNLEVSSGRNAAVIRIVSDIVPTISGLSISSTSFPALCLNETNLNDVEFRDVDMGTLEIADSSWRRVTADLEVERVRFRGRVDLESCVLTFGSQMPMIDIVWDPSTRLTLWNCTLDRPVLEYLTQQAKLAASTVILRDCTALPETEDVVYSPGRQFVNRLVALCRKHRHQEYGVFRFKLLGRSLATSSSFSTILGVLAKHKVIANAGDDIIKLTHEAENQRFSAKSMPGQRPFEEVAGFWTPIIADLDDVI